MFSNKFAIINSVSLKVLVTSYSEKIIKMVFESGFKTVNSKYKVVKI